MRLRNTSGLPDEVVREVINFVKHSGLSKFDVMVKKSSSSFAGMAYYKGSGFHMSADPFITLRIGPDAKFPMKATPHKKGRGYLGAGWICNRLEALVFVAAHEMRHLWQSKVKKGYRVWGARGQFSERDADAYGIRMLRAWRREHGIRRVAKATGEGR